MRSFMMQQAQAVLRAEKFTGLQSHASGKEIGASATLRNLRRMPDGSLARREAIRPIATLPWALRGAASTRDAMGRRVIYAVAGRYIYAICEQEDGGDVTTQIGTLQSEAGEVSFFVLDGEMLLMDGNGMYALSPHEAGEVMAYLPLYGKEWTADGEHPVYQPRNVLTDQVCIRYRMTMQTGTLKLWITPLSIDAVCRNGVLCDPSEYTHNIYADTLTFSKITTVDEIIDVVMTLPQEEGAAPMREDFYRCRCAVRPVEVGKTVALFGGGNEPGVLYLTEQIDPEDRERCRAFGSRARMLYLRADGRRELGDGAQDVKAMVRHYDRTLIMTDAGTWTTDGERLLSGDPSRTFLAVNSTLGCSCYGGALTVGNHPISLCGGDVLEWNADTDTLDECNAESIADAVRAMLPTIPGERGGIYYDKVADEVWLYGVGAKDALIWQRRDRSFTTYRFGSLPLAGVFDAKGVTGLLAGGTVYLCDGDAACDLDADGGLLPIDCLAVTHRFALGTEGRLLRPYEGMICVDAEEGQEIDVTLTAADGRQAVIRFAATGESPCELVHRILLGRCRHAVMAVRCACVGRFTLRAIAVAAGA